jgi:hypothetical protein
MTCLSAAPQVGQAALTAEASNKRPPLLPRSAGGLSGRPFCRIYQLAGRWILEIDPLSGGWLEPPKGRSSPANRLVFATLADAIGYAERHGLDYRIVSPPRRVTRPYSRPASALPRSWLARLARNGRLGEIYHG